MLALAACAGGGPDATPPITSPAPDTATDAGTPRAAALPESAPAPEPAHNPAILNGLTVAEVTRLLGAPRFSRAEDPSALWRYGATGCVLDLYFRADGAVYRVVHFEFRPDPRNTPATAKSTAPLGVDATACFTAMLRVPPTPPG